MTPTDVGPNAYEDGTTSVNIDNQTSDFLVYPVPTNNILHLKNFYLNANKIEIIDSYGQLILARELSNPLQESSIDVSTLRSGVYFIKVSESHSFEVLKIIIQH